MNLDITASFVDVFQPTPFGTYDADTNFQRDADGMVKYIYSKLGGRALDVELTVRDVYTCFEEAMLEYSAMINSYQAKSALPNIIGMPTGSISQFGNIPRYNLAQSVRQAEAYSAEALVGGQRRLHSGSILLVNGQQNYDLQVLMSASGQIGSNDQIQLEEVFYFPPSTRYQFFDTSNSLNYLHNEFKFESFTPETVFYMLPVWEDILRVQQMELSQRVRRSNYSYHVTNNVLRIYPAPSNEGINLFFTYYLKNENPYANDATGMIGTGGSVTNIGNVPFGNIPYSSANSMAKQWVRRFTLALAKEVLGQVRSKSSEIPIPNGALTLNGLELIAQARDEMSQLRDDLKGLLDSMTYANLATSELNQADALQKQLSKVPMGIYVG